MWLLRSFDGKEFFLLPGQSYIVGRKETDLILDGDASISRRHASLSVSRKSRNAGCLVTLRDLKSKYGTFKKTGIDDWERFQPEREEIVGNGEVIKFGALSQIWTFKKCVVSPSSLAVAEKTTLAATLAAVGAEFSFGWSENCTHLTMNTVMLTVKAVCALALGVPIVTPGYWRLFEKQSGLNQKIFLPRDFIPPFGERTLDASRFTLDVLKDRRQLFAGMRFVFANQEQLRKKGCLVTSAGGEAIAYNARVFSFSQLCEPQTILVNFFSNESQETLAGFAEAIAYSEEHGRRKIPESEIGLAILECSMERHCNPLYRPVSSLLSTVTLETQTQSMAPQQTSQVLALETQDSHYQENRRNVLRSVIIPESGSCSKDKTKETQDETPDIFTDQTGLTEKRNRKRQGETHIEEPFFKKPTVSGASMNLFTGETSTVRENSRLGDLQDSKDILHLDLDAGQGNNEDGDDPFNFSKSTRSKPSRKRSGTARDDDDDDLFGSLTFDTEFQKIKEEPSRLEPDEEDADMFSGDEADNVQISSYSSATKKMPLVDLDNSNASQKSRKVMKMNETNMSVASTSNTKFVQKSHSSSRVQKNKVTSDNDKSDLKMSKVSLKGFLSAIKVEKREPIDVDDLQEATECMVLVDDMPLVVRREPPVSADLSTSNPAAVNFKRFRKVMPPSRRPTIFINQNSTLFVPENNRSVSSEDENQPAESQQCFAFVKKRKR